MIGPLCIYVHYEEIKKNTTLLQKAKSLAAAAEMEPDFALPAMAAAAAASKLGLTGGA